MASLSKIFIQLQETMENSFGSDIVANPHDPTPWLVMSDWLEEQGDHRRATVARILAQIVQQGMTFELHNELDTFLLRHRLGWDSLRERHTLYLYLIQMFPFIEQWIGNRPDIYSVFYPSMDAENVMEILPQTHHFHMFDDVNETEEAITVNGFYRFNMEWGEYDGVYFTIVIPKNDPLSFELQMRGNNLNDPNYGYEHHEYIADQIYNNIDRWMQNR